VVVSSSSPPKHPPRASTATSAAAEMFARFTGTTLVSAVPLQESCTPTSVQRRRVGPVDRVGSQSEHPRPNTGERGNGWSGSGAAWRTC
jgi:hypothetical protein